MSFKPRACEDGIVHAGPGPDEPEGDPRVVIFMTYRTLGYTLFAGSAVYVES